MGGSVEKKIRVDIEALVKGLKDVKEFQGALKLIKSEGNKKFNLDTGAAQSNVTKFVSVLQLLSPAAESGAGKVEGLTNAVGGGSGLLGVLGPAGAVLGVVTGATVGLGAGLFALLKYTADAGARFHDLSLESGLSVETLSGLETQLKQSGASAEDLNLGVYELQKNLAESARSGKQFGLGITDAKAALQDTEGTLRTVLKSLAAIPDEGTRNAEGARAMGRAYKQLRVFIQDTNGDIDQVIEKARAAGLVMSREAAEAADEFGDNLDELGARAEAFARTIGGELLPQVNELFRVLIAESQRSGGVIGGVADFIGGKIRAAVNDALFLIAAIKTAKDLPIAGALGPFGGREFLQIRFRDNLREVMGEAFTPPPPAKPAGPTRGLSGGGGGKGAPRNSTAERIAGLEAKEREALVELEDAQLQKGFALFKDSLDREQKELDEALADRLISLKDYYSEAERLQLDSIDNELARQEQALRKANDQLAEKNRGITAERAAGKITDEEARLKNNIALDEYLKEEARITGEIEKLERDREETAGRIARAHKQAAEELKKQLDALRDELDAEQGNSLEVAERAIRKRMEDLRKEARTLGGDGQQDSLERIDRLERILLDKAKFDDLVRHVRQQLESLNIEKERVDAAVRTGAISEAEGVRLKLQAERDLLDVRTRQGAQFREDLKALQVFKERISDPEILAAIDRIGIEVGQLGVQIDEVARHINEDLKQSFKDTAFDIIRHTKTVGEAFRDLADHILDEMARLASDNIIEMLFGENGIFSGVFKGEGGIGGIFSTIFNKKPAGNPQPAGGGTVTVFDPGKLPGVIKNFQGTTTGGFTSVKQATDGVRSEVSSSVGKIDGKMDEIITFLPNLLPAGQSLGRDLLLKAIQLAGTIASAKVAKQGQPHAAGGLITGEGTGTSDSILTRLSNGEFVIRASSVRSIGVGALEYINDVGRLPRYALGGLIGDMPAIQIQGGAGPVVFNQSVSINARDAQSFRQSEQQIKRDLSRATLDGINRASSRPR